MVIGNGNGGLDLKKLTIWILALAITLIGVIYAKDTTDVKELQGDVKVLKADSSNVNTKIAVIETKITAIEASQKRTEERQVQTEVKIDRLLEAVNSLARDSSRRNP